MHAAYVTMARGPGRIRPWSTQNSEVRRDSASAAAEQLAGIVSPPPARPNSLNHPIRSPQFRLDRGPIRSDPPDRDPTADILRYWFGLALFDKEPPSFLEINPQSLLVQKKFQFDPVFST